MLEVLGKHYYIDIDKIIERCRPVYVNKEETEEHNGEKNEGDDDTNDEHGLELNVFKFECYKTCIERILNEYQETDNDSVSTLLNKAENPSFGIAFNTLLKNEILTTDEDNDE